MIWSLIAQGVTLILDLLTLRYSANKDKDLEVLVLRQQIRILERRVGEPVRSSQVEKLMLALTAVHIKEGQQAPGKRQGAVQTALIVRIGARFLSLIGVGAHQFQ